MDRLDRFTRRHRVLVAVAWLLLLLAALPFTARQTEHRTSGGCEVPGSGAQAVEQGLADFENAQRENLAAVIAREEGASQEDIAAAVDRVQQAADDVDHVALDERAAAAAEREAANTT